MPYLLPGLAPSAADAPFVRLWRGFLTGRVMVALALLFLQGLGQFINLAAEPAVLAVCLAYLAATLAERALAGRAPPPPNAGPRWLPFIGVDLLAVSALQLLQWCRENDRWPSYQPFGEYEDLEIPEWYARRLLTQDE